MVVVAPGADRFHGHKPVPHEYEPIAASKRAGEDALREMRPTLDEHGITLVVVSGDMIDGTVIVRLLERHYPGAVAARRRAASRLPTVAEFGRAIAQAIQDPHATERTIYVGGHDYLSSTP